MLATAAYLRATKVNTHWPCPKSWQCVLIRPFVHVTRRSTKMLFLDVILHTAGFKIGGLVILGPNISYDQR